MESRNAVILRCVNIHKKFALDKRGDNGLHVLKGIDLEIATGEVVSIVGASGAGKSTLLHILGGLDRPTEGEVYWGNVNIAALNDDELARLCAKKVGFVFQFHHLLPEFTASENVALPAMILGEGIAKAEERASELLAKVGLADRAQHKPSELSGGEQQRVAVARALMNNPEIVLADEPSGNLDSTNAQMLHSLIFELNETAKQTFVIVTHNEDFARQCHRVFRITDGFLRAM